MTGDFRPAVKAAHWPVRLGDDVVRIGGPLAKDIRDPDGWAWALVTRLDGTRTVRRIIAELAAEGFGEIVGDVAAEVRADLAVLIEAGFVENAAARPPAALTARELDRYSRGLALWQAMDRTARVSPWEIQEKLKSARVVVVGVGGVGGAAVLDLAQSGVGRLHLADADLVELSNLNRQQLYVERDIGRPKVEAAVERLRAHNTDIAVTGERLTVTGPAVLAELAAGADVLVLAADRPGRIRAWADEACGRTGTAWVHGGYRGPLIGTGTYRPGGACYACACLAQRRREAALPVRTPAPGRPSAPQAAAAYSAGLAGHLVARAVLSLLTGVPELPANHEHVLNLLTLESRVIAGPALPGCPACDSAR
ncbi:ThiF family adenylyltransferase [Amycolatopsis sp. NPDC049159]|uniref:ThiF family adenylyltransferase n=1 Tax=Amycolatopsis sp. NPDC049159 TaxID=3157210 RepID=UPI00340F6096